MLLYVIFIISHDLGLIKLPEHVYPSISGHKLSVDAVVLSNKATRLDAHSIIILYCILYSARFARAHLTLSFSILQIVQLAY